MSLASFIKKQFIDILQWTEDTEGVLSWRYPMDGLEIQNGGTLVVRESQVAVFVNEGQVADVFGPGTYKLTTQTLPVLTYLRNWDKLFQSPFKSDVYFFSTRIQTGRRWGTQQPITIRDADFGMVRLRAFGLYSYRVADAKVFHKELSGTRETYTRDDVEEQLRGIILATMANSIGASKVNFLDMAANQTLMASQVKGDLSTALGKYGLALDEFNVASVSLPEELQAALDKRISIGMAGDLNKYTQYQTANAIPIAARQRRRHRRHRRGPRVGHGDRPADGAGTRERHDGRLNTAQSPSTNAVTGQQNAGGAADRRTTRPRVSRS